MNWLLWICSFFQSGGDIYYVSHVAGSVCNYTSGKQVEIGDKMSLKDSLVFSSAGDRVAVINPVKGRFVVQKIKQLPPGRLPGIILAINENLVPANTSHTLAGRGVISNLYDLKLFFTSLAAQKNDTVAPLLLVDTLRFTIDKNKFSDRQNKFFFVRYTLNNEIINKRLAYHEPSTAADSLMILIDRSVQVVDNKKIDPKSTGTMRLFYYDASQKTSEPVGIFMLNSTSGKKLLQETKVLYENLLRFYQNDAVTAAAETSREIVNNYGYCDPATMRDVLMAAGADKRN